MSCKLLKHIAALFTTRAGVLRLLLLITWGVFLSAPLMDGTVPLPGGGALEDPAGIFLPYVVGHAIARESINLFRQVWLAFATSGGSSSLDGTEIAKFFMLCAIAGGWAVMLLCLLRPPRHAITLVPAHIILLVAFCMISWGIKDMLGPNAAFTLSKEWGVLMIPLLCLLTMVYIGVNFAERPRLRPANLPPLPDSDPPDE